MKKHCDILLKQRPHDVEDEHIGWAGSWFARSNQMSYALAGCRLFDPNAVNDPSVSSGPLTRERCLLDAIERAQELGYESFSITEYPFQLKEDEQDDTCHDSQYRVLSDRIAGLERTMLRLVDDLKSEIEHLDSAVDQRFDTIERNI